MIEFAHVHLSYDGKKIFQDLSFEIKQGEKIVLLGKSGSGKSSLFSLILGFVQPEQGAVIVNGTRVDEKTVWAVRKMISYIDQDVSIGMGRFSDLLHFFSGLKTNSGLDDFSETVHELIDYFELNQDHLTKSVQQLSGGERQRLAIILSVLLKRKLFLLDEITSALDKHLKKKVVSLFLERNDWTSLIISHDPVWHDNLSVKVFNLETGKWKP